MKAIFIVAIICLTLVMLVYLGSRQRPKDEELPLYRDDPCPICKHWDNPDDVTEHCKYCKWSHRSNFEPKE